MSRENPEFKAIAQPGEPLGYGLWRTSMWIYAQVMHEHKEDYLLELSKKDYKSVEEMEKDRFYSKTYKHFSPQWDSRAITPLIDRVEGILVGVWLDHLLRKGHERFAWQSRGVIFESCLLDEYAEEASIKLISAPEMFKRNTKVLDIFMTNCYQEAENGRSGTLNLIESDLVTTRVPILVDGMSSILLWISQDRNRFMRATYDPIGYERHQEIEDILRRADF